MMTYKDGIEYATDYEFSLEQLADPLGSLSQYSPTSWLYSSQ